MGTGKKRIELVVGAGWWDSLNAALDNGANAVYFGVKGFNLRANARSFELSELKKVVSLVHSCGARAYLTLNSIVYQQELDRVRAILKEARVVGVDGVICWDLGVVSMVREMGLELHISTQASVSNMEAVMAYASMGARRIVLARELDLSQIGQIAQRIRERGLPLELEVFVHGAMCISISGRCFMSEFLYQRSANRGDCLQPCRRRYRVIELQEGREMELGDGYVLSPRDLATVDIIEEIIDSGVSALKIEGRTRPAEYIARVTRVYRSAIEDYYNDRLSEDAKRGYLRELSLAYNRGFSKGFYLGRPIGDLASQDGSLSPRRKVYVGRIERFFPRIGVAEVSISNRGLMLGEDVLITGKKTGAIEFSLESMQVQKQAVEQAGPSQIVAIYVGQRVRKGDKVFVWEGDKPKSCNRELKYNERNCETNKNN